MKIIHSDRAGAPHGHYVQAIAHGDTIYVSGILGHDGVGERDMAAQAAHVLDQLEAILQAAGSGLAQVLKLGVFVTDLDDWPTVNAICAARFGDHKPARIVVPCGPLRLGSLIEMDVIAASGEDQ
jgi:reactive intermediate/imine deaminase